MRAPMPPPIPGNRRQRQPKVHPRNGNRNWRDSDREQADRRSRKTDETRVASKEPRRKGALRTSVEEPPPPPPLIVVEAKKPRTVYRVGRRELRCGIDSYMMVFWLSIGIMVMSALLFVSFVVWLGVLGELLAVLGVVGGFLEHNGFVAAFVGLASLELIAVCIICLVFQSTAACGGAEAGQTTSCLLLGWVSSVGLALLLLAGTAFGALAIFVQKRGVVLEQERLDAAQREAVRVQGIKDLKASLKLTFKSWGADLATIFKDFDGDGNGEIDEFELYNGLRTLGATVGHREVHDLFTQIDVDGSGDIDYAEFAHWFDPDAPLPPTDREREIEAHKEAERAKEAARREERVRRWSAVASRLQRKQMRDGLNEARRNQKAYEEEELVAEALREAFAAATARDNPGHVSHKGFRAVVTKLVAARHLGGLDKKAVTAAIGHIDPAGRKGAISYNQFKDWFKKARAEAKANAEPDPTVLAAFEAFDEDGSGAIDHDEFRNVCSRLMPGMMDEETLRDALLELDPDGDGEISFEEFEAWYSLNLA